VEISTSQDAPPVSTTPVQIAASINNTGGKFAAGVNHTRSKFATVSTTPVLNCHRWQTMGCCQIADNLK